MKVTGWHKRVKQAETPQTKLNERSVQIQNNPSAQNNNATSSLVIEFCYNELNAM